MRVGESKVVQGWAKITTPDGGKVSIYTMYLHYADDFDSLNLLIDALSQDVTQLIHRIMQTCGLRWPSQLTIKSLGH